MADAIFVMTACASAEEAERIAAAALAQRLAACATVGAPVTAHYRWQGEVASATEIPLTLKTCRDCFPALSALLQRLHSYELPEIVALPILEATPEYRAWLSANTACSPLD